MLRFHVSANSSALWAEAGFSLAQASLAANYSEGRNRQGAPTLLGKRARLFGRLRCE